MDRRKFLREQRALAKAHDCPKEAWDRFVEHSNNAKARGIAFEFSFLEWWNWWQTDDRWQQRGAKSRDALVMARFQDKGPYSPTNTYCITVAQNLYEGKWGGVMPSEKMRRVTLTLTNPGAAWLRREAKRLGVSIGELIRRIIDQVRT